MPLRVPAPALRRFLAGLSLFVVAAACPRAAATPVNTHPALYADDSNSTEVVVENRRVVSETLLGDGRTELVFAADVRNTDGGAFSGARLYLGTLPTAWNVEVVTDRLLFPEFDPAPSPAVAPTQNIVCRVPAAALGDLRTALLAGQYQSLQVVEWMVFTGRPALFNDLQPFWLGKTPNLDGSVTLTFASGAGALLAGLGAGDILTINPRAPLTYQSRDLTGQLVVERSALEDFVPFEISGITTVGTDVLVTGRRRALEEVLASATLLADQTSLYAGRDFYDPTLEDTLTLQEQDLARATALVLANVDPTDPRIPEILGFRAKPIPFGIELLDGRLRLDGALHLRALATQFEMKVRNFSLRRLAVRVSNRADLTMALNAAARTDNVGGPLLAREHEFDPVPLPAVPINLGGVPLQVQPWLTFKIGAELAVPQRVTIPLMASYNAGVYMGWDAARPPGDQYFFTPFQEVTPLRLSDPTLFNQLAASASVYAEAGLKVILSEGSPSLPGLNGSHFFSAGPSFSARLTGTFTLAPLADPWWTLDGRLDFFAGFNWSVLGYSIVDQTAPVLSPIPLFSFDAGGPIAAPRPAGGVAAAARLQPVGGRETRWGRAFQLPMWPAGPLANAFSRATVVPVHGTAEDLFVAGANNSGSGAVLRVDGRGDVTWVKQFPAASGCVPETIAPTPDGGFVLAGTRYNGRFLSKYDAAGARQWTTPFSGLIGGGLNFFTLEQIAVREPAPGTYEYFLAGHYLATGSIGSSDPVVLKFNHAGAIQWMKSYALPGNDQTYEILPTSDGNLVLCGTTDADVLAPVGAPSGDTTLINFTANGLLLKITPEGALLWAQAYPSRNALQFNSVTEAPDGTLYAAGTALITVVTPYPAMFVGRFDPVTGEALDHVTISADPDSPDPLPASDNPSLPPSYKDKAFDNALQLRWTPEGLALAGVTRIGDARSAWAGGLTPELGLRWFTVQDGRRDDEVYGLCATTAGLAVVGASNSFLPFGGNGTWAETLLKLPWEGSFEFHEATRAFTGYIKPRIYKSSGTVDFTAVGGSGVGATSARSGPVAFTVTDLTPGAEAAVPDLVASATLAWVPLERRDPAQIRNYDDWVDFFRIPAAVASPTQNHDGDARTNAQEFFFGGTPYGADTTAPAVTIEAVGGSYLFTVPRSSFASTLSPVVETSVDLQTWSPVAPPTFTSSPVDPYTDLLSFTLTPTAEPRRFWRVSSPVLP